MGDERPVRLQDGLPRSPSGRVPQWVLDEAAGRTVSPVPFRAPTLEPGLRLPDARRGAGRTARVATAVVVACALAAAGIVLQGQRSGPSVPVAGRAPTTAVPAPAPEPPPRPLGVPPPVQPMTEGEDYRFSSLQDDGRPVTWSPCRPVRYVTRPDHAPAWGSRLVTEAIARISAATGLQFEDAGTTTEAPTDDRALLQPDRYGSGWAPVLIAWGTPDEVPDLGAESVLARAWPIGVATASGDQVYVSGEVQLDPQGIAEVVHVLGPEAGRAVVLHELGHLVGLSHVNRDNEVMAPEGVQVTELGLGDRAGLAALGRGPCPPEA